MDVYASLRHLHMAPRKVRLVINAVRGLPALEAEIRLSLMNRGAVMPVLKLLRSAMANAEHNFHLNKQDLAIKKITADGGPTLKRFRPRAFGRGASIRNRTTHIELILAPKSEMPAPKKMKKKVMRKPKVKAAATASNAQSSTPINA